MIDFPHNPSLNQIFNSGVASWLWDGTKWVAYAANSFLLHKLPGNPPAGPGANLALLYVVPGTSGTATLRMQAGTSAIPNDIVVNGGGGF
jgi:hypothetical protein